MKSFCTSLLALAISMVTTTRPVAAAENVLPAIENLLKGDFRWTTGGPVVSPAARPEDPCHAIKDPTFVRFNDRWHLFCTIRSEKRSHQIEYLSFDDWPNANASKRHVLTINDGYFCAPQVFYFTPHKRWYLIHQVVDQSRKPALQPAFSTSENIADPASWTKPQLMFREHPANVTTWIDFWVICDDTKAHLSRRERGIEVRRTMDHATGFAG